MALFFLVIFVLGFSTYDAQETRPMVNTPYGQILGTHSTSYEGNIYSQFLAIPYAQPPIGNLRFLEPQPIQKWKGVWNANQSIECIQITHEPEPEGGVFLGDEDCLYLSVFVPGSKPVEGKNLDVIVHIHGGAFNFGYGNNYAGPKYLMDINVVFVTFNYRLGPLGFLSTEDDVVPGNNGMKDQTAALKWIKENIKYFGGNPDSITITGLSAGGASVHYHYLSPLSKGLFKAGISTSGTALCPWTFQERPLEKTKLLAAAVGCNQQSTKDLIDCLRNRPARQIVENVRLFRPWLFNPFSPFGLVVEKGGKNPFLPDYPYALLQRGEVQDLPWITSVTSHEGLYPAADYALKEHYLPDLEKRWEELAPYVLDYWSSVPSEMQASVAQKIKEYYLHGRSISRESFPELVQMMSDRLFVVDAEKAARLQAKANKSPVYYYYFSYLGEEIPTLAVYFTHSEKKHGVCHGDDMMYILSMPYGPLAKMSERDEEMKSILLKMWGSFARKGHPEIPVANLKWIPVSKQSDQPLEYLHIKTPSEIVMESVDEMGHRSFWDSLPFEENHNLLHRNKDEL
ncbi:hypothetical protein ILUMI_06060 [Ignelater luminosus]|uniref:Carboxylic ester hydrolase n=1 Tax=Ignelater luminosus TaxID=2038154 RepID=A0A8K0DBV7_IGNLU|nr:hypothetical protein ILUMI_06060 [Ignelater luminosus]